MLNMQELVSIFLTEGRELTDFLEQQLLHIEQDPNNLDEETVNALFRAAHTIKGSAGVVGLNEVVAFTHLVETAFESVRAKALTLNTPLINVLLRCNDHIVNLFNFAERQQAVSPPDIQAGQALLDELSTFLNQSELTNKHIVVTETPVSVDTTQHIYIKFGIDTFRDGFDPIAIVRFIAKQANVLLEHWSYDTKKLPNLVNTTHIEDFESCWLILDLHVSQASSTLLSEAFEYIKTDSLVQIFSPNADLSDYNDFLSKYPTDEAMALKTHWQSLNLLPLANEIPLNTPSMTSSAQAAKDDNLAIAAEEETSQVLPKKSVLKDQRLMRVPAYRLDEMVNQLGELLIATATMQSLIQQSGNTALSETVEHIQQLVDDIQGTALQLRMVQIGETFNRFNRVVRDIAASLGKDIRLQIEGAETELDKSMVERISDPLMHLVRNAMDHGLESPEERLSAGKTSQGLLSLSAYHDSGSIVIEIKDDGRGINRKKVLKKAIEKGIVNKTAELSDNEIDELIFAAGFSTADEVSNLSGRGVGMDVVRKNIEALRGTVHIASVPSKGTTFQLRLPLTLAIIDGFMVRVAESKFVIPLNLVTECIELPEDISKSQATAFMNLRGEMLPFIFLDQMFQLSTAKQGRRSIIVVRYGQHKAGLVVDQVLGEFQTVIKPLGKLFEFMQGISGSSILGSGDIALILDIPKLINTQTVKSTIANAKHEVIK
ncbi:MAG: chemotaxis protein CheA [Alishewanella sp.]|nr:chemotaxis protein CheA [Alishewanella sp.]